MAPVAAEIMPGARRKGDHYRDTERGVQPTRGSTPAMMENAMASGMSANATTNPPADRCGYWRTTPDEVYS